MTPILIAIIPMIVFIAIAYWHIDIRGNYAVSNELSDIIESFLNDKDTTVERYGSHYKIFKSGDSIMKIWSSNWPYGYGSEGFITNGGKIIHQWSKLNPRYRTRKMVRDFIYCAHYNKIDPDTRVTL